MKSLKTVVDELGRVKAQLAELAEVESRLKEQLIEAGQDAYEGKLFRATISRFEQSVVNYKGLLEHLAPPARTVSKFTESKERTTVRVVARTQGA